METQEDTNHMPMATMAFCFFLGAALGAAVAMLTTPASGSEMRDRIKEKANHVKDKAYELKDLAVDRAEQWKEKAVATTADTLEKTSERVRKAAGNTPANFEQEAASI